MLTQLTQRVEGNTIDSTRKRNWCFTWNNYPDDWYLTLTQALDLDIVIDITKPGPPLEQPPASAARYVIGLEVGKKCGTPHLQGYIEFPNARFFGALKKCLPKVSWRECFDEEKERYKKKGITNREANYNYCTKDKIFYTNIILEPLKEQKPIKRTLHELCEMFKQEVLEKKYKNITWKTWQQSIIDLVNTVPDDRTVYWYFDEKGRIGKSFLCKYIDCTHKGVVIADGKRGDVFNEIVTVIEEQQVRPEIILLDIPRDSRDWVNIGTIEAIKNGFLYSGKFKGGKVNIMEPHVIIFANDPPTEEEYKKLSVDRWAIFEIIDGNLKKHEMVFEEKSKRIRKNNY